MTVAIYSKIFGYLNEIYIGKTSSFICIAIYHGLKQKHWMDTIFNIFVNSMYYFLPFLPFTTTDGSYVSRGSFRTTQLVLVGTSVISLAPVTLMSFFN